MKREIGKFLSFGNFSCDSLNLCLLKLSEKFNVKFENSVDVLLDENDYPIIIRSNLDNKKDKDYLDCRFKQYMFGSLDCSSFIYCIKDSVLLLNTINCDLELEGDTFEEIKKEIYINLLSRYDSIYLLDDFCKSSNKVLGVDLKLLNTRTLPYVFKFSPSMR